MKSLLRIFARLKCSVCVFFSCFLSCWFYCQNFEIKFWYLPMFLCSPTPRYRSLLPMNCQCVPASLSFFAPFFFGLLNIAVDFCLSWHVILSTVIAMTMMSMMSCDDAVGISSPFLCCGSLKFSWLVAYFT